MKKLLSILCFLVLICPIALASDYEITENEIKEIETFFNSYINSSNNYETNFINHYTKNAVIERVVIKPNGNKQAVEIPMQRYIKELNSGRKLAKLVNYKNRYTNKKYEKISEDKYKIKTKRIPFKDKEGLEAEFIVTRTNDGLKISHEIMETNVQKFLNHK